MQVGISIASHHRPDDPRDGARWMIERAQAAEAAQLDSLSLGDHHAIPTMYWQNTPMLGRLLAEWGDRPAGCLFLLPLWSPVVVAEHVGTLASLFEGPFIIQTGIGYGEGQFAAMRADHSTRGRVLEESVTVIKGLLAGDTVDSPLMDGPATIGLRPKQDVEWWLAAGAAPVALDRAARLGDAWYASPGLTLEGARDLLHVYTNACQRHGTTPRSITRKDVIVLSEPGAAARLADDLAAAGYRGMARDVLVAGTPAEVAHEFRRLEEIGFSQVVCRCMNVDQSVALETIEGLGEVKALLG